MAFVSLSQTTTKFSATVIPHHKHTNYGKDLQDIRAIAQRAFSRSADAPLIGGNSVKLLIDAELNYDAWIRAIAKAKRVIYFENYIIHNDKTGRRFRDALTERAEAGVKVRVLHDWVGCFGLSRKFWEPLLAARGRVRVHNPPKLYSPVEILSRDHRKMLAVDGHTGFVSGICISDTWLGNEAKGIEPWRDTGVEIRGPAVTDLLEAFRNVWAESGRAIDKREMESQETPEKAGDVDVRVIATSPRSLNLYRLDLMITAIAQKRLWLTDAYFAGVPAYVQALKAAAQDGVDVRLLVPGGSDLPWLRPISTAGYRPLLESGVRVFEWNGSMLHAKTAVADDRWARVGSTNLNIASWMTNHELDVAIENEEFATKMAEVYENDLEHSTEIVLRAKKRVRLPTDDERQSRPGGGSIARVTAGALRLSRSVSAAVLNHRVLGPAESRSLAITALMIITLAAFALLFPRIVSWIIAAVLVWTGIVLLLHSLYLYRQGRRKG